MGFLPLRLAGAPSSHVPSIAAGGKPVWAYVPTRTNLVLRADLHIPSLCFAIGACWVLARSIQVARGRVEIAKPAEASGQMESKEGEAPADREATAVALGQQKTHVLGSASLS